ncbi:Universal stress protein A-like protein [Echinococcus granulosus]|uniref:Universal stress protein n=1 Tax=Echinococcus granulosus TaxID=6210 RepID=U6JD61_ECHGR|nr:Universal stress protein A-like protein [Echinococcus granulosus]EUB59302.1 Universal stress protein A-like protein [Echinococcus granulosus]KAH9281290.1 Universal stress protein A-like protein [Echinococcus granulosus]CDS22026.1 universal stress protein [Echinococcus granulosus]
MSSPPTPLASDPPTQRAHQSTTRSNSESEDYLANVKRRVLLSIDANENSSRAFEWYTNNFAREDDGLLLVHVVEPVSTSINYGLASKPAFITDDFSRHIQELVDEGRELGKRYLHKCKGTGIRVRFMLHIGAKPGEHICRLAKEQQVDVIVMGSRGMGRIRRTLLGSVSDFVLHHAGIPVVVIPPPKKPSTSTSQSEDTSESAKKRQSLP